MTYQRFGKRPALDQRVGSLVRSGATGRTSSVWAASQLNRIARNYAALRASRVVRKVGDRTSALVIMAAIGLAAMPGPGWAQAPACGTAYTIEAGDTLYKIAERVYGDGRRYEAILAANAPAVTNATKIDIGDLVLLPCLDGSGPQTRAQAVALGLLDPPGDNAATAVESPEPQAAAIALPVLPARLVRAVAGTGFAPYSGPELQAGGMVPALIAQALAAAAPGREVDLAFADDPARRLDMLAPGGGLDLGYPWFRPACETPGHLDPVARRQCAEFAFSDPVVAIPVGVYIRRGDPLAGATALDDLAGKRLCRPAGHFTFDLEQAGLTGPGAPLNLDGSAEDCFRALVAGRVDAVTMARHPVAPILRQLRLVDAIAEVPDLASTATLHAIAAKANPEALELLAEVDRGMERLRTSGAWFEAVLAYQARGDALMN